MTYGKFPFPYNSCNTKDLNSINSNDRYFEITEDSQNHEINQNQIKAVNLCDDDLDINLTNLTDCKYYSVDEFQKNNFNMNFNIFHNNVNGLETKFENLHNFFANSSTQFDIITITET